jgi:hypothetical protein
MSHSCVMDLWQSKMHSLNFEAEPYTKLSQSVLDQIRAQPAKSPHSVTYANSDKIFKVMSGLSHLKHRCYGWGSQDILLSDTKSRNLQNRQCAVRMFSPLLSEVHTVDFSSKEGEAILCSPV